MSETPKTDHILSTCQQHTTSVDYRDLSKMHGHAQKQEKEITALAEQCVAFVEEIGELRERVKRGDAMLRGWREDEGQDAKRLEWLDSDVGLYDIGEFIPSLTHQDLMKLTLREGIDKAMEELNK